MEVLGDNKHVAEMYNTESPMPGRFIRFLTEKNSFKKNLYGKLIRTHEYRQDRALSSIKSFYNQFCPPANARIKILDVGCGTGERTLKFAAAFPNSEIIAIDISKKSIEFANQLKEYVNFKNVKFAVGDALNDDLSQLGSFDIVHNSGNLHHLDRPEQALRNFSSALKKNGLLGLVFVYANFRDMHAENVYRQGVHVLFPRGDQFKERVKFVKSLGVNRYTFTRRSLRKSAADIWRNIRTLGFYYYTKNYGDNDNYDAFGQPCAKYYTGEQIKQLVEQSNLSLSLVHFRLDPEDNMYREKLAPELKHMNLMEQLQLLECFNYPNFYHLIFKKN